MFPQSWRGEGQHAPCIEAFYGLTERPFSILPDPAFLHLGRRHALAYSMLEYGIAHGAGFTVITGGVGCGKTILIQHLLDNLGEGITVGLISNTCKEIGDLLKWVLLSFGQPYDVDDKVALFDRLQRFLIDQYGRGQRTVLIIDEAQNLDGGTLEELRMLSNINSGKDQLLNLVLVGQPQLKALLRQPELEQFVQRVSSDFHVTPLERDEVAEYIRYRLKVAGREEPLFEENAEFAIFKASGGVPRRINILCDTALVYGFSRESERISTRIVLEMLRDKAKYGVFDPVGEGSSLLTSESPDPDDRAVPCPVDPGQTPQLRRK
ncbi:ExeA family protein [endosymbiont of unidentified scaly snail isolate Monju]|uniref:ExeA family protein n=1 Tax=endosymbiont of unidentified scaly snail isolate Monju TaxID=1248727 RepID=UPI00038924D9|nr:AAA family ATPase [endosymbiont of unidentified scaly snail isolate Monju]BAN68893.1 general secretion pathway protein A [endosymbiont of unidentified scaly snail isolate Monju]